MRLVLVILCWAATALGAAAQGGGDPRLAELRERIARRSTAEAVSLADRIADEALQAGSPGTAALALRLVGNFHLMEERLPQARAALTRARDVAQTHGLVVPEQAAILLLSRADALEGRADAVTPMVLQALDVLERQQAPHEELIWAYSQAATALLTTGVHGDVLARGVARLTPTDRFAPACSLWQSWGDRNFNTADYGEAHEALTKALACYEALGERADTGRVLVSLGRVQRAHGQLDAALALYQRAARLIEDARSRALASDAARRGYGETTQGVFAVAIDVAMRRGATTNALELAEQARARALLDLMRDGSGQATAVVPDAAAMRALAAQLASTLLVYWVGADHTLAWVIGPDRITAHRLPAGETELRRWVQEAAGSGNVPGAINAALLGGPSLRSWRALHRALIAPLAADLPTDPGSRLTVVPHGPLLHLPFAGLLDTRGRYLIERHTLHYTPSIAVLAATVARASGEAPAAALVVGEPTALPRLPGVQLPPRLPYAREEARRVARRFGDDARLVLGRAATERAVRAQVGAAGWVHVATHARVSEEATAPSYLLLARGTGEAADDGRLTADEVRSLSLAGATVVLSACRTALGRVTGEGTLGFTRSFLAAGARAIVATTWEMPDDAGLRMMDAFYAARAGGSSVTAALRTAQLRQLRALRAGTLTRKVGGQEIRLPATPLLWAGYLAVGVP
jgi:CHAT domain-containing protein